MIRQQVTERVLSEGASLDGYRLEQLLGVGTHAEVWLATNTNDGTVAVLKMMDVDAASRCYTNARSVEHSDIMRPTAMFNSDGKGILVMPPCMGRSVEGLAGYASEQQAWQLLTDIASALTALHSVGMTHGNVCAENILWDGERFLLTGFSESSAVSNGGRPADDVWQLGATIFYLCMGCHVFNGMGMKAQRPTSPLPYMRKSIPQLSETVQRCLAYSGRPSAEELLVMAKKGQKACTGGERQHKMVTANPRRLKTDFWPDAMRRVVVVMALLLCWLTLPAQGIYNDEELSQLVSLVVDLRNNYSKGTYDKVSNRLSNDQLWTQMCELDGPLRNGECSFTDDVEYLRLNKMLNRLEEAREEIGTHGDALNGEDREHKYSLYECAVKADASVRYELEGRMGAQVFIIVPFNREEASITAEVTIGGILITFREDLTHGLLEAEYQGDLKWEDLIVIDICNSSSKNQAFVIINYNTWNQ